MPPDEISVDLEDWQNQSDEWNNVLYRVTVESHKEVALIDTWLSGESLHNYSNLNKNYERISAEQSDVLIPNAHIPLHAYAH